MIGVNGNPIIFTGNSNPKLSIDICEYLNQSIGNDNTFVKN